jgi:hypothetical protein
LGVGLRIDERFCKWILAVYHDRKVVGKLPVIPSFTFHVYVVYYIIFMVNKIKN